MEKTADARGGYLGYKALTKDAAQSVLNKPAKPPKAHTPPTVSDNTTQMLAPIATKVAKDLKAVEARKKRNDAVGMGSVVGATAASVGQKAPHIATQIRGAPPGVLAVKKPTAMAELRHIFSAKQLARVTGGAAAGAGIGYLYSKLKSKKAGVGNENSSGSVSDGGYA